MNVCVAPVSKNRAADQTHACCPDPTPTCNVSYHRDASLRLLQPWSCRHLKSLWFAGRRPLFEHSVLCVSCCRERPKVELGHDRPPLHIEVQQKLRGIPNHVRPSAYRLCLPKNVEYHADHALVRSAQRAHVRKFHLSWIVQAIGS